MCRTFMFCERIVILREMLFYEKNNVPRGTPSSIPREEGTSLVPILREEGTSLVPILLGASWPRLTSLSKT